MAIHLKNREKVRLTLRFRLFDDGIGFRYEYDIPSTDSLLITDELTAFNFRQEGISWSIPASAETYELLYRKLPLSEVERSEEHTSELQSRQYLVCRLLLEKKNYSSLT